ncbi:uncharacterized protein LOC126184446 [Schistocerca cancellata]|uniref:uncharacterized protein LOC126184446 n=1 Tax=Schistocerca cancellata TaxID=274614 RepID=UPI002117A7AA|nr:uncharacterized protein LOC126184446 [Schistocerca cancellata]
MLESTDEEIPNTGVNVTLHPPLNSTDDVTDEDSGAEENPSVDKLPANDIDLLSRRKQDLEAKLEKLERYGAEMGLTISQSKTKYMLTSWERYSERERSMTLTGKEFEHCESVKYLGNNDMREEIRALITADNRSYSALIKDFKVRSLSRDLKLTVYRTVVRPMVMYGLET